MCDLNHPNYRGTDTIEERLSAAFVYPRSKRRQGSVQVRSIDLPRLLGQYDPSIEVDSFPIEFLGRGPDCIVASKFVTKVPNCSGILKRLRRSGARIFFDLVDGNPRSTRKIDHLIDGYICASHPELSFRKDRGQPAFFVPHNVDSRLTGTREPASRFRVGYSGAPYNALHLDGMNIEVFDSSRTQQGAEITDLPSFLASLSHHYSVRKKEERGVFKPSLKIYIAALYQRAFVGSREDPESLMLLGDDYPYLARSSSPEDVAEVLAIARETFGGKVHALALQKMAIVRRESCPAAIASRMRAALQFSPQPGT